MFSITAAFSKGWHIFKDNAGFLLGVHLLAMFVQVGPQLLLGDSPGTKALVAIISLLASFVLALGLVRIGLSLVDGEPVEFGDLFSYAHLVFKYLVASLLHGFLILFGLLLLVAPGLYWAAQFSQWPYLMVEHEMGPIEAMKESSRITRATRGNLILFFAASVGLVILGFLALFVGSIVAYALITVTGAYIYREILADQPPEPEVAS